MNDYKINNMSADAEKYEFIVARMYDGEFWYWGAYKDGFRAAEAAQEINGVVFHNVKIQGYHP